MPIALRKELTPVRTRSVASMSHKNTLQIPYPSGTKEYQRCHYLCEKTGKSWPEITEEEKIRKIAPKGHALPIPPSTMKVQAALSPTAWKTLSDIVRETGMNPRTVRYSLVRLRRLGRLSEKINIRKDARKMLYALKTAPESEQQETAGAMS